MTSSTFDSPAIPSPTVPAAAARRRRAVRLGVGYAAVLGTLPYLTLKVMWLAGSPVGLRDVAFLRDPTVEVLNAITAGMDALVIVVALALTHSRSRAVPAWMVIAPMWVAVGLLGPIAVLTPVQAVVSLVSDGPGLTGGVEPLEPWVRPMVYGSFTWQAVTLIVAFVLYALDRWATVLRPAPAGLTAPMSRTLARGAAVPLLVVAGFDLAWAVGADVGLPPAVAAASGVLDRLPVLIYGLGALAAVFGGLAVTHGRSATRVPGWLPVAGVWAGTGAMVGWGLYGLANVLGTTVFGGGGTPLVHLLLLVQVLGGLVMALAALGVLADRFAHASARITSTPQHV